MRVWLISKAHQFALQGCCTNCAIVCGERSNALGSSMLGPACDTGTGTSFLRLVYVSSVCLHYTVGVGGHAILRLAIGIKIKTVNNLVRYLHATSLKVAGSIPDGCHWDFSFT